MYIVRLQHISMRTSHISGVQQPAMVLDSTVLYLKVGSQGMGFCFFISLDLLYVFYCIYFTIIFGGIKGKYLNTQCPFTNKKCYFILKKKKKHALPFLINLEIKSEDISASQANDQKNHVHVSSKRQGSQVETEKEDPVVGEGKLGQWHAPHQRYKVWMIHSLPLPWLSVSE